MDKTNINNSTPMEDMTIGGTIYNAGNSREVKTGDWRSMKPIFDSEKCKQCGLCFPVCPEDAIPVNKDGNREDFNYELSTINTLNMVIDTNKEIRVPYLFEKEDESGCN